MLIQKLAIKAGKIGGAVEGSACQNRNAISMPKNKDKLMRKDTEATSTSLHFHALTGVFLRRSRGGFCLSELQCNKHAKE